MQWSSPLAKAGRDPSPRPRPARAADQTRSLPNHDARRSPATHFAISFYQPWQKWDIGDSAAACVRRDNQSINLSGKTNVSVHPNTAQGLLKLGQSDLQNNLSEPMVYFLKLINGRSEPQVNLIKILCFLQVHIKFVQTAPRGDASFGAPFSA
jgi:hypothetical protein